MKKIVSVVLIFVMLMGLMNVTSFATSTLPTDFGWGENGVITITVPEFSGDEIYYCLDLYKDDVRISEDFGNYFDASGVRESDVFVNKIAELGNGKYKYKIGFERDDDTDEIVNATDFSEEYTKTDSQPISDLPTALVWNDAKKGCVQFNVPAHIDADTNIRYSAELYKDNQKVDSTIFSVWINTLDDSRVFISSGFQNEIYENGSGNYTYTISYNSETTTHSEPFNYVKPSISLAVPADIVVTNKEVRWTPVTDENCGGYWVDYYVGYPNGEYFKVYGQEERGKTSCSQSYIDDGDVEKYSTEQIDRLYAVNAAKYPKESAFLAATVFSRTNDITACNSSAPSSYVNITEEEDIFKFTLPELSGVEGGTIISGNIYDAVPQSMQFGLLYASSYYDGYITEDAKLTFENSSTKKIYVLENSPLKWIGDNEFNLEIPLNGDLPAGTYKLTIELAVAEAKETDVVKPFVITIQNVTVKGKQTITFMVNGEIYSTNKQPSGERIEFPEINTEGFWFRGWSVPRDYTIPEENITVTADVVPLATIKGKVIGLDGTASENSRVYINTYSDYNNNGMVSAVTDEDGKFELVYPQGELLLTVCRNADPYLSKEITVDQTLVDLGEIELTPITSVAHIQKRVETIKGIGALSEALLTEEEKALVDSGEKIVKVACSAGNIPVVDENSAIAQEIANDSDEETAVYYIDISMNKYVLSPEGILENANNVYETPQLIEIIINIPDELEGKNKYIIYREHTELTENGETKVVEKITTSPNEFGEYLTVTDGKISLFVKRFSTYGIVGVNEKESEQPTYISGGGRTSSTTVSVPTSTGVKIKATVSGFTAAISEIDTSKTYGETAFSIDMSGVKKTVKSVKLPVSAIKDLTKEDSTIETFEIKLSSASVSFDAEALKVISEEAQGDKVTLYVDNAANRLTTTEKNALKEISSPTVVEVSLLSNNKTISNFKGGKAVVSASYKLNEGQLAESVVAKHIGENGILATVETSYDKETEMTSFVVSHFSKYVISAVYEKDAVVLNIGQKDARVFGEIISNDVAPKIVKDRTMLPIRFIAEKLGASVDWVQETQTVVVGIDDSKISLNIGENFATVNGERIELDSPSFIEDERTFLPIRFVMESLGADILWHHDTQSIIITK